MKVDLIQASTPLLLGIIGGIIGIIVIFSDLSETKTAAGLGLAGTAIAGASGLAQSAKKE
ncbi:MAG: hypothetical protein KME54_17735 [Tolypothrix brevis GSE-NOS-MK-07-07A]|jgi:hypothetical protein|nr:hypothetical protein [Tolypothrix brevis GSE-NOS-MK-07-07A]